MAVVALEYALSFGLWFRGSATRANGSSTGHPHAPAYVHYTLRVHTFSATMLLMYIAYISPEYIHQIAGHDLKRPRSPAGDRVKGDESRHTRKAGGLTVGSSPKGSQD